MVPAGEEPRSTVAVDPAQPAPSPESEKKRMGRNPSEGEPLRRVLIILGQKEIIALRAEVGGKRGVSTLTREILKDHLAAKA
jgi:hypothetical protein